MAVRQRGVRDTGGGGAIQPAIALKPRDQFIFVFALFQSGDDRNLPLQRKAAPRFAEPLFVREARGGLVAVERGPPLRFKIELCFRLSSSTGGAREAGVDR